MADRLSLRRRQRLLTLNTAARFGFPPALTTFWGFLTRISVLYNFCFLLNEHSKSILFMSVVSQLLNYLFFFFFQCTSQELVTIKFSTWITQCANQNRRHVQECFIIKYLFPHQRKSPCWIFKITRETNIHMILCFRSLTVCKTSQTLRSRIF